MSWRQIPRVLRGRVHEVPGYDSVDTFNRALAGHASINPVWPVLNAHMLQEAFTSAALAHRRDAGAAAS